MKKSLVVLMALALYGCTDSAVDTVQKQFTDEYRTITLKQALENALDCSSHSWEALKNAEKRTIVKYSCSFADTKDFFKKVREHYIKTTLDNTNYQIAMESEELEERRLEIEKYRSYVAKYKEEIKRIEDVDYLKNSEDYISDFRSSYDIKRLDFLNEVKETALRLQEQPNSNELISFFNNTEVFNLTESVFRGDRNLQMAVRQAAASLRRYANKLTSDYSFGSDSAAMHEQERVKNHLSKLEEALPVLVRYADEKIPELQDVISKSLVVAKSAINDNLSYQIQDSIKEIERQEQAIISTNQSIERLQSSLGVIEKTAEKRFPVYESLQGNFYWVVNSEQQSFLTGSEIVAISKNSENNKALVVISNELRAQAFLKSMLSKKSKRFLADLMDELRITH